MRRILAFPVIMHHAVRDVVNAALERAGVESSSRGAHQFRHTIATRMLSNGATLTQIGEILRHRRPDTTMIYTKVDVKALRAVALPWPEEIQ
jgi:integrase/recombinase XerD